MIEFVGYDTTKKKVILHHLVYIFTLVINDVNNFCIS